MAGIRILDPQIAAQIAAGEVIERPTSVVKELAENAIDAGSRHIEVQVTTAPGWQIVVRDDGCGIPAEEVELAFARHATSKLAAPADLERITSLGFRGEALPSIAAVAEVEMLTRPADAPKGTKLRARGGEILENRPHPCAPGTRVTVSDLFYNLPARRKSQAEPAREVATIAEVLGRLALAYPDRAFILAVNGRILFRTSGRGDLLAAITAIWGRDLAQELVAVEYRADGLELRGYLGRPGVGRADRRRQFLAVNGRPVVSSGFGRLLDRLYAGLLPNVQRPVAALQLWLPPERVDANVHPAKLTVRIVAEEEMWEILYRGLRPWLESLSGPGKLVQLPWPPSEPGAVKTAVLEVRETPQVEQRVWKWSTPSPDADNLKEEVAGLPPLEPLGQLAATYILAQSDGDLYIIDQHAAHERIRYAELARREQAGSASQMLAAPLSRSLAPPEAELFWRHAEVFRRLGYLAERFGPGGILFRGLPAGLSVDDSLWVLEEVLSSIVRNGRPEAELAEQARRLLACRGAIKANQYLDRQEMVILLEELRRTPHPFTCPHGRPTILRFSAQELLQAFGRR
ncbi:MAG: DNA mismatch repair endonuclease MutL [Moorellales bacterium]